SLDGPLPAEQSGSGCRSRDELESRLFASRGRQDARHLGVRYAPCRLADLARDTIVERSRATYALEQHPAHGSARSAWLRLQRARKRCASASPGVPRMIM